MRIFSLLILLLLSSCGSLGEIEAPFVKKLSVSQNLSESIDFRISEARKYHIDLMFPFKSADERKLARQIAGDFGLNCTRNHDCGSIIMIKIVVKEKGGQIIFDSLSSNGGHQSFSASGFFRQLTTLALTPGHYNLTLTANEVPQAAARLGLAVSVAVDYRESSLGD